MNHEPYVAEPAEPAPRRRLAGLAPTLWTLAIIIALIAGTTLFWQGRGQQDPALDVPGRGGQSEQPNP